MARAIGHLQNPELCGAFRAVEGSAATMNQNENVLEEVICL
jgi:hypothetical protein